MPAARSAATARLLALSAVVFWGLSFVATKLALAELSPVPLIALRFTLGLGLLGSLLAARGKVGALRGAPWPRLAFLGFLGIFVHQLMQAYALTLTSAVNTGWLIGIIPIWSAILAAIFLGERLTPVRTTGLVVGLLGVFLIMTRGRALSETIGLPSTRGDLIILASTVNWAVYTILARGLVSRIGALPATTAAMFVGWVLLMPFFFAAGGPALLAHVSPRGWAAIAFLGIGCSGLGYLFWYGALEVLPATQVSAFLYLEPLVTLVAAWAVLGEPVHPATLLGGVLVLAGVGLVQRRETKSPRTASS